MSDERTEILALQEISDPPTWPEVRLFLADPEIDFTPADLVTYLRKIDKRMFANHRKCAGCDLCSDGWVIEHAAEYMETMIAMLDALEEQAWSSSDPKEEP